MFMSGCMLPFFGNEAPVIQSSPPLTAVLGVEYSYQIEAIDDNDANLTYRLLLAPDGMTIDSSTGFIKWIPQENQLGANQVQVKASDGWSSSNQEFSVEVSPVKLSSIIVEPKNKTIKVGETFQIDSVTATYSDSSNSSVDIFDCSYQSNNSHATVSSNGIVSGQTAGSATITVTYTEDGITKTGTIAVTVYDPPPTGGG